MNRYKYTDNYKKPPIKEKYLYGDVMPSLGQMWLHRIDNNIVRVVGLQANQIGGLTHVEFKWINSNNGISETWNASEFEKYFEPPIQKMTV